MKPYYTLIMNILKLRHSYVVSLVILLFGNLLSQTRYPTEWCPTTTFPNTLSPTLYGAAAWLGDTLYFQGSTDGANGSTAIWRYTLGGTWTTGVLLPSAKIQGTLTSASGKLYYIGGGATAGTASTDIFEYTPSTGLWLPKLPIPAAKSGHTAHAWGDSVIFIVGGPWATPDNNIYAYRIASNTWVTSTSFTGPARRSAGGGMVGNKIFVGGGFPFTNTFYIGTIGSDASQITWTAGPNYPSVPKSRIGGVAVLDRFYLIGGNNSAGTTSSDSTFIYTISSGTWSPLNSIKPTAVHNISNACVFKIVNDTVKVWAIGGTNQTITATPVFEAIACGPAVVGIENNNEVPLSYNLFQNYPNPFNPTTQIKFYLPKDEFVTLKLYDILGAEVKTLVEGSHKAGIYEITADGSELSGGVYFYRLTAGTFTDTKKMILVK